MSFHWGGNCLHLLNDCYSVVTQDVPGRDTDVVTLVEVTQGWFSWVHRFVSWSPLISLWVSLLRGCLYQRQEEGEFANIHTGAHERMHTLTSPERCKPSRVGIYSCCTDVEERMVSCCRAVVRRRSTQ